MKKKILFGFYSEEFDNTFGHFLYKNAAGEQVKVSVVHENPKFFFNWKGATALGEMGDFVKSNWKT